jgi:maltooligosyltrehalose trehalohydrolase
MHTLTARRLPIGAEFQSSGNSGEAHFRVWAPKCRSVDVMLFNSTLSDNNPNAFPLAPEPHGYFSGSIAAAPGTLYKFRLDGRDSFPDPASRSQPQGPHGPSAIVDPHAFAWTDESWPGVPDDANVIYEMHIGTFTPQGTWRAAAEQLAELASLGITILEVMPIAEFPGNFGWGYDGVNLYAPSHLYGSPDDLRFFIDRAHAAGLAVILDVVYNHLGPDGNYLTQFSPHYFTSRYKTDWGEPLNFDDADSGPVREYFISNARYWIEEFHLDGLRLDATQQIFDASATHILREITSAARSAAGQRKTFVVAENECQEARLARPISRGGYGIDALWNDDFHHAALVALTGRNEAYYTDYHGTAQEFISCAKYGFLYQGQWYSWQTALRGSASLDLPASAFVNFIENHDQVANSATGARVRQLSQPGAYRSLSAMLFLLPGIPMLFQGQEYGSTNPFLYFADHEPDLAAKICAGRAEFLSQFPSISSPSAQRKLPNPCSVDTFDVCKLDFSQRALHPEIYALHKDLIQLRITDPVIRSQTAARKFDGAVLAPRCFLLRMFGPNNDDRLLIVNFSVDLVSSFIAEPLLAPPENSDWALQWSSEDPRYGGTGIYHPDTGAGWNIPGNTATLLKAQPLKAPRPPKAPRK